MLNVYLLRHGETPYNAEGNRYCGRTDISLTDKGLRQAEVVFDFLGKTKINAVYSSPLVRARLTAEIASGKKIVRIDNRLIEADFGNWEGKTKEIFIAEDPGSWREWMENPYDTKAGSTGESGKEIVERVDSFFKDMLIIHDNETIMVAAHNGINRLYMAFKLGMDLKYYRRIVQDNASITQFQLDNKGEFSLLKLNAIF
jgi:broad specificity phosphatase PhoE